METPTDIQRCSVCGEQMIGKPRMCGTHPWAKPVSGEAHPTPPPAALHERRSDMTTDDQRALDNIPEFYEEALRMPEPPAPTPTVGRTCDSPQYPLAEPEYVRHGEAMFRLGVIEGLRLARAAVQHDKHEMRALRLWDGLNAAVSAIDSALATYIQKARSDRNGE